MQKVGIYIFMLIVRIAATIDFVVGVIGILWFSNVYFIKENIIDLVIVSFPLLCLFIGIITPENFINNRTRFWGYLALFAMGIACMGFVLLQDIALENEPDYGAFRLHLFSLSILLIFVFRIAIKYTGKHSTSVKGDATI